MITRENYEEFFILYVDNELPATTRSAVEKFVADNPDLNEELTVLMQCRVQPDQEPGLRDKEILFRYGSSLLSFVDGELGEQEKRSVEEWVRHNPRAAEELRQLQMTVSQPDPSVVFPGKESLFRGRRKRAVILPWLSAGVAAAILGVAAMLLLRRPDGPVASESKKFPASVTSVAPATLNSTREDGNDGGDTPAKDPQKRMASTVKDKSGQRKDEQAPVATTVRGDQQKEEKEIPVDMTHAVRTEVATLDPQPLKERTTPVSMDQTKISSAIAVVNIPKEQSSFATQALEQDQDNSIAEVSATPAKIKLRGLFRKVGRALGKTADSDNDGQREVLISAFQVALK